MKIIKVTPGKYEEIETDETHLNLYRRHGPQEWEHYLGDLHGWHFYRFTEFLNEAYDEYMREHGERNPDNITNA